MANLGINTASVEVPDRRYTTDTCAVSQSQGTVKLIFAQETVDGKAWRSVLVVHMSNEAVSRFLATLEQMGSPGLDTIAASNNIQAELLKPMMSEPHGQAIALSANLVLTAASGNEACLDFYQASAFSLSLVFASKKLALEPIVRVDLRTSLLLALVAAIRATGITAQEIKIPAGAT